MLTICLPVPPSVNNLYPTDPRTGRRYKSSQYRRWLRVADGRLLEQWSTLRPFIPVRGKPRITIRIPARSRMDASNAIKAAEDFLVSRGITEDDRNNWSVTASKDSSVTECVIEIEG